MSILDWNLYAQMPDGSVWTVPVSVIAYNRAENYKDEFGGDLERSLKEDTEPLFEHDFYEIEDWAENNMNWSDVEEFATKVEEAKLEIDFEEGWVNGEKKIAP